MKERIHLKKMGSFFLQGQMMSMSPAIMATKGKKETL